MGIRPLESVSVIVIVIGKVIIGIIALLVALVAVL